PHADLTAVTAYVDGGQAAARLADLGALNVVVDGDNFAAPETFFAGSWTIIPRSVQPRRLHGKAYWSDSWLLAGSPNLSTPALLQTAANGNTELAVIVNADPGLFASPLPGSAWSGQPIEQVAPGR